MLRRLLAAPRRLQRYSATDAVAYAKAWALKTNPAYGRLPPNDCTNFVSQALLEGGWKMVGGSCDDRKRDDVWWWKPMQCRWVGGRPWKSEVKASFTWGGAQNFYNFVKASGRGTAVAKVADLKLGDVLQMDFGAGEYNGGRIGHTMIVTKKTDDNVFLSYHTSDHLDEPFWGTGGILERYPKATYYGWNL